MNEGKWRDKINDSAPATFLTKAIKIPLPCSGFGVTLDKGVISSHGGHIFLALKRKT